jgi:hypothetical protein
MEIERLYEMAMRDIVIQVKLKSDQLYDRAQEFKEHQRELEQVIDMIKLRIKSQSQQKFVKEYMGTMKEAEKALEKRVRPVEHGFE